MECAKDDARKRQSYVRRAVSSRLLKVRCCADHTRLVAQLKIFLNLLAEPYIEIIVSERIIGSLQRSSLQLRDSYRDHWDSLSGTSAGGHREVAPQPMLRLVLLMLLLIAAFGYFFYRLSGG